ncbi:Hsp70 family protein [Micromonospora sp. M61]|uniref:Hsp70 family protein n=1 Tax=Micromonospora sp. M61 TaxID=2824890 RepID=UPI001B37EEDA|nr:Hsp70 family protein [Micromonospora sp. M61]MBQ0977873.1 Hsp70 family protein [Micromonospora sp. M61]
MGAGEARLSIDCGSAGTQAVLAWADGSAHVLTFDGNPAVPSAPHMPANGQAAGQPAAFIPGPRHPMEDATAGDAGGDALEVAASPLRRVAAEAERVVGQPVRDVRVVVPAGWGPRRRTWMRQVAHRAGLPQPRLVEAPVAVAEYLLTTGVRVPVGAFLVVCDVGAGAEVTVLRRGPAGFEVLATLADAAAGGTAIDHALADALIGASTGEGQRASVADSVRVAKEALVSHPAVTVPLPDRPPVIANSAMLDEAVRPVAWRVAQLTQETVAAAELTLGDLAGIYCVGGSAQLPHLAAAIAEHTGTAPIVVPEPALVAARGAADVGAVDTATVERVEVPVPPVRRAAAIAVPGFASLALIWQCLLTAERHGTLGVYYSVSVNWGEFTMAAVMALLACLAAGTVLGSLIAARSPTPGTRTEGGRVSVGILAAVSLGAAIAGLYAVVTSQYFGMPVGPYLKWALWPIAPVSVMAVAMAVVAARQWRAPHGGWSALLAAPTGSIVAATLGMGLIQYSLTADRWPDRILWIDIAGRVGGLLLGVAVVMAVVTPLMFRLILAAPLAVIFAAIVSRRAAGMLGVIYAIAVATWWATRLWSRVLRPAPPTPTAPPTGRVRADLSPGGGG